jgi:hypothetical protein
VGAACGTCGKGEKNVQDFDGNDRGKRPLRRLRHRCEDGIRMGLKETGWGGGG